ncbi:hypothetical protein ACOME3_006203 [Neoechinorhynchus agilis]
MSSKTFHCLTRDCPGFEIIEMNGWRHIFECHVCLEMNCIQCEQQHDSNISCTEFSEEIKLRKNSELNKRKTRRQIEELIASGSTMRCPNCLSLKPFSNSEL